MADAPREPELTDPEEEHRRQSHEVVVRAAPAPPVSPWARRAVALRARLPELARHPAVVGTAATIATGIAANVVRRALGGALPGGSESGSVHVSGYVVHHVHVIHHVVHHVPALPPSTE